jgi:hypothetical protein
MAEMIWGPATMTKASGRTVRKLGTVLLLSTL